MVDFYSFAEELERLGLVVFTVADVARITGKPRNYCWLFLKRLEDGKKIIRVERGKYCLKGADPYTVASRLVFPSYVSFLSALAFHHLTTQVPVVIQVACSRQKRPVEFGGSRITFTKLRRKALFGFRRYNGVIAAEPEKAIIDILAFPGQAPTSEAFYAIRQGIDAGKLEEYARRLGSSAARRRVGFLLENAGIRTALRQPKATRYEPLNPLLPRKGRKNSKWKLLVNEVLE